MSARFPGASETYVDDAVAAKLAKASNLSDLASASSARTNLGLGDVATHAASEFDAAGAASSAVATHEADTTNVHGITDTSKVPVFSASNAAGSAISAVDGSALTLAGAFEHTLSNVGGVAAGATTLTVDRSPAPAARVGLVAIGVGLSTCEVRNVTAITTTTLTFTALAYAHSQNERVIFFGDGRAPASWWGLKGNGNDENVGLQEAIRQTQTQGLRLDLQGKTYNSTLPLLVGPSANIVGKGSLKADSAYAISDANGAFLMNYQGSVLTFTASASTDIFTTPSAHGLPADDIPVVFKTAAGGSLPTGITAGKVYFCQSRTTTTFKVSATKGGSAIDLTADGSGTVYCEVTSLNKFNCDGLTIEGNNVAGLRGMLMALQQQSNLKDLRVNNCPLEGFRIHGQQAEMSNVEFINCNKSLVLDDMSFLHVYGFNAEKCDRALWAVPGASSLWGTTGGGGTIQIDGIHIEMTSGYSTATSVAFDIEGPTARLDFGGSGEATLNTSGQTFLWVHTGNAANSSYRLGVFWFYSVPSGGGVAALRDDDRGIYLDAWHHFKGRTFGFFAADKTTSSTYHDPAPWAVFMPGGGVIGMGASNDDDAKWFSHPSDSQAGDSASFRAKRAAVTFVASTDTLTWGSAHNLSVGNELVFTQQQGQTLPAGINVGQSYYVLTVPSSTTATISATQGGSTLDITADGQCYARVVGATVSPSGVIVLKNTATPTVGRSQGALRVDPTTGGAVWTGKQSDGTSKSITLNSPIDATLVDAKGDLIGATAADTVARVAVGANGQVLTADSGSAAGFGWADAGSAPSRKGSNLIPKLQVPAMIGVPQITGTAALTTNRLYLWWVVIAENGSLNNFQCYNGTASGNCIAAIYDIGDTTSAVATRLWTSGSVALGGAGNWFKIADPALSVTIGQQVLFAFVADNATATMGNYSITGASSNLNNSANRNGVKAALAMTHSPGSFTAPSTIANASLSSAGGNVPMLIAEVA